MKYNNHHYLLTISLFPNSLKIVFRSSHSVLFFRLCTGKEFHSPSDEGLGPLDNADTVVFGAAHPSLVGLMEKVMHAYTYIIYMKLHIRKRKGMRGCMCVKGMRRCMYVKGMRGCMYVKGMRGCMYAKANLQCLIYIFNHVRVSKNKRVEFFSLPVLTEPRRDIGLPKKSAAPSNLWISRMMPSV